MDIPVQPGQQALCGSNELHHRGEKVVGGLAGGAAVIRGAPAALRGGHVQTIGGGSHPHHQ